METVATVLLVMQLSAALGASLPPTLPDAVWQDARGQAADPGTQAADP
ncbi:MAG: hypothetical protein IMZ55_04185, partial [Acidobacteria bacterium]|nr:hypothetical protein [Acidobacteriota bacterium]